MKKLFSILLSLGITLLSVPFVHADSTQEQFLKVLQTTFEAPVIFMKSDGEAFYGSDSVLTVEESFEDSDDAQYAQARLSSKLSSDLFGTLLEETFPGKHNFSFDLSAHSFVNKKTQDVYLGVDSYSASFTSDDLEAEKLVKGFLEFPKLISEKTFQLNLQKLSEDLASEMPEMGASEIQEMFQQFSKQDIYHLYAALVKSGIFTISGTQNVYTLTFAKDLTSLDIDAFFEEIEKIEAVQNSEELKNILASAKDELASASAEELKTLNEEYTTYRPLFDTSITMNTSSGRFSTFSSSFEIQPLPMFEGMKKISVISKGEISYPQSARSYKIDEANTISLTNIFESFRAMESRSQAMMNDYYDDYEYDATLEEDMYENVPPEGMFETPQYHSIEEVAELTKEISEDAWFKEHAENVLFRGLAKNVRAGDTITSEELGIMLKRAGFDPAEVETTEGALSKFDAIKIISRTIFPNEKNPVRFFIQSEILKSDFSVKNAQEQKITRAEVFKLLDLALQKYESGWDY